MSSEHLTGSQHTPNPPLDEYLKGIRDEFNRINRELEEAKKQRDEYMTKYRTQAKELRELRQTMSGRKEHQYNQGEISLACGVADDDSSRLISPASSSSEYYSEEESTASDQLDDTESLGGGSNRNEVSLPSPDLSLDSYETSTNEPGHSAWDVELASNTTFGLSLRLVHKLTHDREGEITRASFSMDGEYLATTSGLGIVSIFESRTGKRISVMRDLHEKSLAYNCLDFSPDGKFLATGDVYGRVRIWIISQRRVRNIFRHEYVVYALKFSPDGQCIGTCSSDGTVRIWRLRDGFSRVLATSQFSAWSVRFSEGGRYIASGHSVPQVMIWTVRTGNLIARWQGHGGGVASVVFTPDGNGLLSASWDRQVIHWDVASLSSLGLADPLSSDMREISRLIGHTYFVETVSISPDGKWIASGSSDKTVRLWNAHDATLHCILHCPGPVWSVDFSRVGNYLAIGGEFDEVTIWNYA